MSEDDLFKAAFRLERLYTRQRLEYRNEEYRQFIESLEERFGEAPQEVLDTIVTKRMVAGYSDLIGWFVIVEGSELKINWMERPEKISEIVK